MSPFVLIPILVDHVLIDTDLGRRAINNDPEPSGGMWEDIDACWRNGTSRVLLDHVLSSYRVSKEFRKTLWDL